MNKKTAKYIIITALITTLIFSFLVFLIYTIYCYAFYDKHEINELINKYNSSKYDYIYEHFNNDNDYLNKDNYNNTISLTFNRSNLLEIYELYYKNIYSEDEFLNKFYYGNKNLKEEDFEFDSTGKTTLFKRKQHYYKKIYLNNDENNKTIFGILTDTTININPNSELYIDNNKLECNEICKIDKIYGGIHYIKYIDSGYTYIALLNINTDKMNINIYDIESLTAIEKEGEKEIIEDNPTLISGYYGLSECFLTSSCPSSNYSYVILNEDNTCEFHTYITIDKAGDSYLGTYIINNGFLILKFNKHTYEVFDYDTKVKTDIEVDTNMTYTYKILDDNSFINDQYKFKIRE